MKLGYNTNGLAFHRWQDAFALTAETGFRAVAITLDHHCLNPFSPTLRQDIQEVKAALARLNLAAVIETGARFLLNPRVKHEPTLMSPDAADRAVRIDFLNRSIDIAAEIGAEAVSFWSGILHSPADRSTAMDRLVAGCQPVVDHAALRDMKLAFEPEPGMFIESFADFAELNDRIAAPHFGLTVDIGHVQCVETGPISDYLKTWHSQLFNIHIEDMCKGVHDHLRFGEGEIDFPPVLRTLSEMGYQGCVNVELSRHSHMAPEVLRESYAFLSNVM